MNSSAFRAIPKTGVIYVSAEAAKRGYTEGAEDWCNLGQGQPETGTIKGAPARLLQIDCASADFEYAPVAGLWELRETIASLYNNRYRRGLRSQYTAENVSVSGGGRLALLRALASLGHVNLGHFIPDYTAYEELLGLFRSFTAIPIPLDPEQDYELDAADLEREIRNRGLSALLVSNPNNPTGRLVDDEELPRWTDTARRTGCALLLDEFYAHYVWTGGGGPTSAARFVEDVNEDQVILFDGLTKNWRYPGWRVTWTVGPRTVIDALASAGSFLDGGGSKPVQRAAIDLLSPDSARAEAEAIRAAFAPKRAFLLDALRALGIRVRRPPDGTFYAWGDLSGLPRPLSDGMGLLQEALSQRVIVVPGEFFDIDPGKRRGSRNSRFANHARFSFGPSLPVLTEAVYRLSSVIASASAR